MAQNFGLNSLLPLLYFPMQTLTSSNLQDRIWNQAVGKKMSLDLHSEKKEVGRGIERAVYWFIYTCVFGHTEDLSPIISIYSPYASVGKNSLTLLAWPWGVAWMCAQVKLQPTPLPIHFQVTFGYATTTPGSGAKPSLLLFPPFPIPVSANPSTYYSLLSWKDSPRSHLERKPRMVTKK